MQHGALRNIRGRRIDEKLHLVECWSAEKQNTAKVKQTGRRKTCESVPAGRPLCHSASSTISAHLTPIHWALHWLLDMHNAWVCPHALGPSGNVLVETHLPAVINASTSSSLLRRSTMQKSWKCLLQGQKVLKSRTSQCSVVCVVAHWWAVVVQWPLTAEDLGCSLRPEAWLCGAAGLLEGHLPLISIMMCRQSSLTPTDSSVSVSVSADASLSRHVSTWQEVDGFSHSKERTSKLFRKKWRDCFYL